jgi:hypothetical protein
MSLHPARETAGLPRKRVTSGSHARYDVVHRHVQGHRWTPQTPVQKCCEPPRYCCTTANRRHRCATASGRRGAGPPRPAFPTGGRCAICRRRRSDICSWRVGARLLVDDRRHVCGSARHDRRGDILDRWVPERSLGTGAASIYFGLRLCGTTIHNRIGTAIAEPAHLRAGTSTSPTLTACLRRPISIRAPDTSQRGRPHVLARMPHDAPLMPRRPRSGSPVR